MQRNQRERCDPLEAGPMTLTVGYCKLGDSSGALVRPRRHCRLRHLAGHESHRRAATGRIEPIQMHRFDSRATQRLCNAETTAWTIARRRCAFGVGGRDLRGAIVDDPPTLLVSVLLLPQIGPVCQHLNASNKRDVGARPAHGQRAVVGAPCTIATLCSVGAQGGPARPNPAMGCPTASLFLEVNRGWHLLVFFNLWGQHPPPHASEIAPAPRQPTPDNRFGWVMSVLARPHRHPRNRESSARLAGPLA